MDTMQMTYSRKPLRFGYPHIRYIHKKTLFNYTSQNSEFHSAILISLFPVDPL